MKVQMFTAKCDRIKSKFQMEAITSLEETTTTIGKMTSNIRNNAKRNIL